MRNQENRRIRWKPILGASVALFCLAAWLQPVGATPALQRQAPPLTIKTADGSNFDLQAMRGRVVLVTFWATWCGTCLVELPVIEKFYRQHRAEGFEVIALSVDEPQNRRRMQYLLSKLPFPGALLSDATRNGFGEPDWVPVSYLIDGNGVVRRKFTAVDQETLNQVISPMLSKVAFTPPAAAKLKRE